MEVKTEISRRPFLDFATQLALEFVKRCIGDNQASVDEFSPSTVLINKPKTRNFTFVDLNRVAKECEHWCLENDVVACTAFHSDKSEYHSEIIDRKGNVISIFIDANELISRMGACVEASKRLESTLAQSA